MRVAPRIFFLLAIVIVGLYLWAGRSHWYSEVEREVTLGRNPRYSGTIDIAERGQVSWTVPTGDWVIDEGEAHISIVFDRVSGIPSGRYSKDGTKLRGRFDAYAVDGKGMRTTRRIRNWYFTTDEPLSPDARLWASDAEFGLGGVWVYPHERLVVTFEVIEPDAELAHANPRLKIVPKHDYAVFGIAATLRLIRDGGLIVCAILLIAMTVMYWRLSRFAERAG